eukprot:6015198-Amphidinium_carterae.1
MNFKSVTATTTDSNNFVDVFTLNGYYRPNAHTGIGSHDFDCYSYRLRSLIKHITDFEWLESPTSYCDRT